MQVEYLIIGQGISGTFLSYYLSKEERSFLVIDDNDKNAPSKIAAGIINPVTGRRMVIVWMADEILPFAWKAYQEIGNELNITAISQKNIIDFFPNPFMRENFLKRLEEGNEYIQAPADPGHYRQYFNYDFGCGEIKPVYTAHLETLIPAWRQQLIKQQKLSEENFELSQLKFTGNKVLYKNIIADKIIFCDGAGSFDNPYFKQLPFAPNKGEVLIAEVPGLAATNVYKKTIMMAPLQYHNDNLFWIGSNYTWDFSTTDPTTEFCKNTEGALKEWLKIPFKIIDHRAGIRPATLERRPFAGIHPYQPNVGILNGMGTKGCSLAPFFAKQLTDHLVYDKMILPEADISRFKKILSRKDD